MLGKGECIIQISKPRIGMWQMGAPNFFKSMNVFSEKGEKNATELIVREGGRLIYVWVTTRILERPII